MSSTCCQYTEVTKCITHAKIITQLDRKIKSHGNITDFKLHRSNKLGVNCFQFCSQLFFIGLDSIAVFPIEFLSYQHLPQFSSNFITAITTLSSVHLTTDLISRTVIN